MRERDINLLMKMKYKIMCAGYKDIKRERVINLLMKMKYEIMCAGYKDIKREL